MSIIKPKVITIMQPKKSISQLKDRKKTIDKFLFDISEYELIRKINSGAFGTIYLVKNKHTNEKFAAKTSKEQFSMSREISILIRIQHPTIIKFKGYSPVDFDGNNQITFLMDFIQNGSLADLLDKECRSLCEKDYDNTKRQIILIGVARGMMVLHKYNVIHRDLKPENILLGNDYMPLITDFGLSKFYDPKHSMEQSRSNLGTIPYMAPEVTMSDQFNTKADVYSFGILMYEVLAGKRAYADEKLTAFALIMKINDDHRPKFDFPIKKSLKKMIKLCWSKDPQERPTFSEIFQKLSLLKEDYSDPFDSSNEESKLDQISDDDIDDESNEQIDMKFCLPNVNVDEVITYLDKISGETMLLSSKMWETEFLLKDQEKEISNLKKENEDLKLQLSKLKKQFNDTKNIPKSIIDSKFPSLSIDYGKDSKSFKSTLVKPQVKPFDPIIKTPKLTPYNESKKRVESNQSKQVFKHRKYRYKNFMIKTIQEQINIISDFIDYLNDDYSLNKNYFTNLKEFLEFISEIDLKDKTEYYALLNYSREYRTEDDMTNTDDSSPIYIFDGLTEYLLLNNFFNSEKFIQILKKFENKIFFSIKTYSSFFDSVLNTIINLKIKEKCNIALSVNCHNVDAVSSILKKYPVIEIINLGYTYKIGNSAFKDCCSLKYIKSEGETSFKDFSCPYSLKSIGSNAFQGCTSLQSFTSNDDLRYIGSNAFQGCCALKEFNLKSDFFHSIEKNTFEGCSSLVTINLNKKVTKIGEAAFKGCSSLRSISSFIEITVIKESTFENCTSLEEINLNMVRELKPKCFCGCSSLTEIKIPNVIKCIPSYAFERCTSLKSLTFPSSVIAIESHAFSFCTSLIHVLFPSTLRKIGDNAFSFCLSLPKVIIPKSVMSIGDNAFFCCIKMEEISVPSAFNIEKIGLEPKVKINIY